MSLFVDNVLPGDVHLDPSTEDRLSQLAMDTGRSKAFHLRELVEQGMDDLEDSYFGAAALEAHRRSGEATIPLDQVIRNLGLEI
jgi:RHH-type rel operon transcriptional repressor/antitoxin RelB